MQPNTLQIRITTIKIPYCVHLDDNRFSCEITQKDHMRSLFIHDEGMEAFQNLKKWHTNTYTYHSWKNSFRIFIINLQIICSYIEAKNERYFILTIVFYFSIFNCLFNVMSTLRNCFLPSSSWCLCGLNKRKEICMISGLYTLSNVSITNTSVRSIWTVN